MGRAIKVQDGTYDRLVRVQKKRESFDREINRLLDEHDKSEELAETLGPSQRLARSLSHQEEE